MVAAADAVDAAIVDSDSRGNFLTGRSVAGLIGSASDQPIF